jgi:osomolarity two-component system, sensor histidine kinase NIK1
MWVESEVAKGSKFYFTISSQISHSTHDQILAKIQTFAKRAILFVDTLRDQTGVADQIRELGLKAVVVHDVNECMDKDKLPHIDTIVVDSLNVVCVFCPCRRL